MKSDPTEGRQLWNDLVNAEQAIADESQPPEHVLLDFPCGRILYAREDVYEQGLANAHRHGRLCERRKWFWSLAAFSAGLAIVGIAMAIRSLVE